MSKFLENAVLCEFELYEIQSQYKKGVIFSIASLAKGVEVGTHKFVCAKDLQFSHHVIAKPSYRILIAIYESCIEL